MTTWHKGPPPSVGWWPASTCDQDGVFRWWNGEWWSVVAFDDMTADQAEESAKIAEELPGQKYIEWTERPASWPERSRT
jgi:hypothetical protein